MCVICIKNSGVELPTRKELMMAFECNPHGCGFVASNGAYWRGMRFDEFYAKLTSSVGIDDSCIIHFRYATHGSHKVSNCHPFKCGDLYFAHNGVLPIRTKDDKTDSETVFRSTLAPAADIFGFGTDAFNGVVNRNIFSSKFAFMYKGKIRYYGRWIKEDDGLIWSNLNHRPFGSYYGHNRVVFV